MGNSNSTAANPAPAGDITVVIGPNGYGKTRYLEGERKRLEGAGESVFFIPSEIKLLDEVKDTVDTSQTMEFLLSELLETPEYRAKRDALFDEADSIITSSAGLMNGILDDVLNMNGSSRTGDFITTNPKRTIKSIIGINQDDIKKKMGSGQRMHLLLKLASHSSRNYIFLDEPEKYSHPSLLNQTAKAINELVSKGKHVFIATHSPKLVSMLKIDFSQIYVINDTSHKLKEIPFDKAVSEASKLVNVGALEAKSKRYYSSAASLKECIQNRHGRAFIETLFAKRVYLCEGANDELLVNAALRQFGGYYDDYCIFKAWGKVNIPVFAILFDSLGIEVVVLFDVDDEAKRNHKDINDAIRSLTGLSKRVELTPSLEQELGFMGPKNDALALMDHLESMTLDSKFDFSV